MSLVSFVKVRRKEDRPIRQAILYSLDLIQYQFPEHIRNVVIKPNMCYYLDYSTGHTTDPKFVAALVDALRSRVSSNVNISIVESDASAMKCRYAFKMLGYEKMAQHHGVALVNLSEDESERVEVVSGGHSFHFMVPQTILNADLRVNVPKIKYMWKVKLSCALKNIYGCNPYPRKFRYHQNLDETIVALNKVMKFNLCIVDGITVSGIQPRRLGLIMASQDPVAIDVAASKIAGLNPRSVSHIMLANAEGLGNASFIPKGIPLEYFKSRYPRKRAGYKVLSFARDFALTLGLGKRLGMDEA